MEGRGKGRGGEEGGEERRGEGEETREETTRRGRTDEAVPLDQLMVDATSRPAVQFA